MKQNIILKTENEFWKTEKALAFFYLLAWNLSELSVSIFYFWYERNGEDTSGLLEFFLDCPHLAYLILSIFLGFIGIWCYSFQIRSKEFSILKMSGIHTWQIVFYLLCELVVAQSMIFLLDGVVYIGCRIGAFFGEINSGFCRWMKQYLIISMVTDSLAVVISYIRIQCSSINSMYHKNEVE